MSDLAVVIAALVGAVAAWTGIALPWPVVVAALAVAILVRYPVCAVAAVALVIGVRSDHAGAALDAPLPDRVGGVAQLVADPQPGPFGTSVELRVAGRRWQAQVDRADEWVLRPLLTGDHVVLRGEPRPFRGAPDGWRLSRHLAGRLVVTELGRGPPAAIWYRAANWVHRSLADGSATFGDDAQSLFLGLVVGDDRGQSDVDRFRFQATGLGHLLAVSGQNVAFVLLLARPLLRRCGLRTRWVVGLGVLALFVLVTRAEASVLRAAAMAAVALVAAGSGRTASGARILGLAVLGLLVVDPLLVRGLGFQLSLCATVGMLVGVRPIGSRLRGPRWFVEATACTVAAQVATAPLLVGLTGGLPSVATATNVLAVPAAGAVMVLGLTVGVVAGVVVAPVAAVVDLPVRALVGWIAGVAAFGSRTPLPLLGPARLALLVPAVAAVLLRRGRRWPLVVGACFVALALRPVEPVVGRTELGDGVVLDVAACGRRRVELTGRIDVVDALTALQVAGVVRADEVSGPPGESTSEVARQLEARVVAGPDPVPRNASGEASQLTSGHPDRPSEVPCTVRP